MAPGDTTAGGLVPWTLRITTATSGTTTVWEQRFEQARRNFARSVADFEAAAVRHKALLQRWLAERAAEVRGLLLARRLPAAALVAPTRRGRTCSLAEAWRVRGPP